MSQAAVARQGFAIEAGEAVALLGRPGVAFVDPRERSERKRHGVIPGALHEP
jgi:hypothetical protein